MSAHDTTVALMAYRRAINDVKRDIMWAKVLSFTRSNRLLLIELQEEKAMLERRMPRLGKRRKPCGE